MVGGWYSLPCHWHFYLCGESNLKYAVLHFIQTPQVSYSQCVYTLATADFRKKVPGVYTHSMETLPIYIHECTGSCGNCFHEIPGIKISMS